MYSYPFARFQNAKGRRGTPMSEDQPRKAGRRRSTRPGLRIPIRVEGKGADGKPFEETTFTLAVNRHGARVRLKHSLRPNEPIMITNLKVRRRPCPFRVVGPAAESIPEEPDWGIESLEPDSQRLERLLSGEKRGVLHSPGC